MSFADGSSGPQEPHPWFDGAKAPIYTFRFPSEMQDAQLQQYCSWFSGWYVRQITPAWMICDMSRSLIISARQRQIWVAFEKRSEADIKRVLRAVAIVVTNSLMRGVVTATYWINPPVYEYETVRTWQQGYDALKRRLP